MKILVMHDALSALDGLDKYLSGYAIEAVENFDQFELKVKSGDYNCIILDSSVMGSAVTQLIRDIKRLNRRTGLIVTSERNSLQERIEALTTGADDFLTKPYEISEMAVRILALVRRTTQYNNDELIYQEIRVDIEAKAVYINDLQINLTKKELDLLLYFIEHKNSVVRKDSLISCLSGQLTDSGGSIEIVYAHVKNLKRKLTEGGCKPYLKTIYGIGYKWDDR